MKKKTKIIIITCLALMILGSLPAFASSDYYFNWTLYNFDGGYKISYGYKDDYAPADVRFYANSNWQEGRERFQIWLTGNAYYFICSPDYNVWYSGFNTYAYYSQNSNPGTRGLAVWYPSGQAWTNATAQGVWWP